MRSYVFSKNPKSMFKVYTGIFFHSDNNHRASEI